MAELHHTASATPQGVTLAFEGEVDIANVQQLRRHLLQALQAHPAVWVDLAAVTSMDSSGIATLLEILERAQGAGKAFGVVALSPRVRAALELLCLDTLLLCDGV